MPLEKAKSPDLFLHSYSNLPMLFDSEDLWSSHDLTIQFNAWHTVWVERNGRQ